MRSTSTRKTQTSNYRLSSLVRGSHRCLAEVLNHALFKYSRHIAALFETSSLKDLKQSDLNKLGLQKMMLPEQVLRSGARPEEKLRYVLTLIYAIRQSHKQLARPTGRKENHFASVFEQKPAMTFGVKSVRFLGDPNQATSHFKKEVVECTHDR